MAAILTNLRTTVHVSLALAILYYVGYVLAGGAALNYEAIARWTHVVSGIMWIGLLWYFNFVQIPNMPNIPDEQKPAIGKVIAPAALFWFRWGAAATVLTGLIVAALRGYLVEVMSLGLLGAGYTPQYSFIGIGMWLALIMAFNVWFVIWPNQKIALGIVEADADAKPAAARTAMLFSRTNTLLSFPMLIAMSMAQTLFG
ncbi:MAG: urate hydroxylase PuuD [Maricaulis sp.]|uniref:urate hydroxylase PuuD n=1 Tax=Maricaulis sp. TaxID=1486257 RepID=UPI001B15D335|nr:urate hydroxylase PuuD [Maricaulis sp.]MBO6729381.1 urate hydroxylase PuuD [Maricaulis sp.]MBO6848242.1 urate hydroxylase PuuD [Maricaulis sp.]MBO6877967.1 urate hydroxylase PuuD [Maricaulis sp.]MDM7983321.1 urate hydroxylase PuuD [Maricaulis sp.]